MNRTDPYYEQDINALIPQAEKEARKQVEVLGVKTVRRSGKDGKYFNWCYFSEFFNREMTRLAKEAGLRKF